MATVCPAAGRGAAPRERRGTRRFLPRPVRVPLASSSFCPLRVFSFRRVYNTVSLIQGSEEKAYSKFDTNCVSFELKRSYDLRSGSRLQDAAQNSKLETRRPKRSAAQRVLIGDPRRHSTRSALGTAIVAPLERTNLRACRGRRRRDEMPPVYSSAARRLGGVYACGPYEIRAALRYSSDAADSHSTSPVQLGHFALLHSSDNLSDTHTHVRESSLKSRIAVAEVMCSTAECQLLLREANLHSLII